MHLKAGLNLVVTVECLINQLCCNVIIISKGNVVSCGQGSKHKNSVSKELITSISSQL